MPDNKQPIGTDFVFRVEGIKLSAKDQERISQAISAAVSWEMLKLAKPANCSIAGSIRSWLNSCFCELSQQ